MIEINSNNEIVVHNVVPVSRGNRIIKFITNISIKEVGNVYNKLVYDEITQRGYKTVSKGKYEVEEKIINKSNIEEMKDKVLNGFFDGGHLIWNVRINTMNGNNEYYDYNNKSNTLIIKYQPITLPDSAQRHMALFDLEESKSIDCASYFLPLDICFYTLEEEQSLFSEINGQGQRANKTRALYLSNTERSKMLKNIIEKSDLKDNVETKFSGVAKKEKATTFGTLYDSLFERSCGAFRHILDSELSDLEEWLIKFYNELITLRPELQLKTHEDRIEVNKKSLASSNVMFYAYAKIAKELYGYKKWKRKLVRINNEYKYGLAYQGDLFSLNNPLWHKTVCYLNKNEEWKPVDSNRTRTVVINEMCKYLNLGKYEVE